MSAIEDFTKINELLGSDSLGFSKREYACIHLELPESGTPWLDELIAKKQRQNIAAKAMQGLLANHLKGNMATNAGYATNFIELADALIKQLNKK